MKKLNFLQVTAAFLLFSVAATAQIPATAWSKVFGGDRSEAGQSIKATPDGGYIIAGSTMSTPSGEVSERIGNKDADYWVVKLDSAGSLEWEKVYGGYEEDIASAIVPTKDGGYIVVGSSSSQSGDVSAPLGSWDIWVVKLNDTGKIEWDKSFGGSDQDEGYDIKQTSDEGYIITGSVNTYVTPGYGYGYDDILVIKLDKNGNVEWENPYGSSGSDRPSAVLESMEGGYFIAGVVGAADSNVTGPGKGSTDWWLLKLSSTGAIEWNRVLGGSGDEFEGSAIQTADSGYAIVGLTRSSDGDVVRSSPSATIWDEDIWVVKVDKTGQNIIWNKGFGGSSTEGPYPGDAGNGSIKIRNVGDGGFLISGWSSSTDYGMPGDYGGNDAFLLKLDAQGTQDWIQHYGGTSQDMFCDVIAGKDGSYTAVGRSASSDIDVPTHAFSGGDKLWVLKLAAPGMDSIIVTTQNNVAATITTQGGTLPLAATIFPRILPQDVTWSIVPGTGTATIDAGGVVTAQTDGTVWGKAVSVSSPAFADSIEITISGQTTPPDPGSVAGVSEGGTDVHIYPNPAGNTVYVQMDGSHPRLALSLLNIDGKAVYHAEIPANALAAPVRVNMSSLPAGIYLLRLEGGNVLVNRTIAKQ